MISGVVSARKNLTIQTKYRKKSANKIVLVEFGKIQQGSCIPEIIIPDRLEVTSKDSGNLFLEIKHKLIECGYGYNAYASMIAEGTVKCLSIGRL